MVAKCANPTCVTLFRYLRGGKLFRVDPPPYSANSASPLPPPAAEFKLTVRHSEYFWLCEQCAKSMTLTSNQYGRSTIAACNRYQVGPLILKGA